MRAALVLIGVMFAGAVAFTIYYSPEAVEHRWRSASRSPSSRA